MAGSPVNAGVQCHVRSISLPSRLSPHSVKIESESNKLKSWEASLVSTTLPLTAETIQIGMVGLAEVYSCIEELIHSPLTQQVLLQSQHGMPVEEALEGSIGLLDSCGTVQGLFLMLKEHVQDLQSALRRKGGDSSIESNISAYMGFRKKMKKDVVKCLRSLKQMESRIRSSILLEADNNLSVVIRVLKEATAITISVFRSLLSFLSVPDLKTKSGGWSLISKLVLPRTAASETTQNTFNEAGCVDLSLHSLCGGTRSNDAKGDVQMARRRLQTHDASIRNLEAGLDCLFKSLIRNRVSLLNILAH